MHLEPAARSGPGPQSAIEQCDPLAHPDEPVPA
jgi:hypothetical protein